MRGARLEPLCNGSWRGAYGPLRFVDMHSDIHSQHTNRESQTNRGKSIESCRATYKPRHAQNNCPYNSNSDYIYDERCLFHDLIILDLRTGRAGRGWNAYVANSIFTKFTFASGTEKRELLSCMKSKPILREKNIYLQ